MSMLDSYRRDVERHGKEVAKLHGEKAAQAKKKADVQSRMSSAAQSASKASSLSSKQSHLKRAESLQKDLVAIEKKIADVESKIAAAQKRLGDAQSKVATEEVREFKKRQVAANRAAKDSEKAMKSVVSTLRTHAHRHAEAEAQIKRLSELPEKITVLFLAANPLDQPALRLDEEVRAINDTIRKSKHRDSVKLESLWAIRPSDVLQALNEHEPHIVHFSGHGSEEDEIVFQDDVGKAKCVSLEAIIQMMMACSGRIRLVFFNTCHSRNQAEAVVRHVEAAIGMKTEIGDDAARVFAAQFYSAIGFGLPVQRAFDQAKALLMMEGIGEEDTPALFLKAGVVREELVIVSPLAGNSRSQ
jgi:hypothetical protein